MREALFQLEAEGLVRIVPQKGAIVSELSLDEINDVFELRRMLEPRMLAQSALRFTAKDFAGLDDIHRRFERAIEGRDVSEWGQLNADFHMALYVHAGSHVRRRSLRPCCRRATATRACSSRTPRRWASPKRNTPS